MRASVYAHVPFCAGACDYCDFYSIAASRGDPRLDAFVDALLAEAAAETAARSGGLEIPTLFVGGGTPSLLGPARLARLVRGLAGLSATAVAEATVEANPESLDEALLRAALDAGVDRMSLGVQSRDPGCRSAVGRYGSASAVERALDLLSEALPGRFSVDLMAGLPLQDERSLLSDVDRAVEAGASHVSLYSLIVEEGTPLAARAAAGTARLPGEDRAAELWLAGRDALEAAGLRQYEVSNFARPGRECRHNLVYWRMGSWLGFGPAASGTLVDEEAGTAERRTRTADVNAWLEGRGSVDAESVSRRELAEETLIMGFRLLEGPDPALFRRRFGVALEEAVGETLADWRGRGLAETDRPALTREGLLFLDAFLRACLAELDSTYPRKDASLR